MRVLRIVPVLAVLLLALPMAGGEAFAQLRDRTGGEGNVEPPRPPARPLVQDRAARLDGLFEALKQSPDARIAQAVEARIEAVLMQSGSPTADLLMARARSTIETQDYELALDLLDGLIEVEPAFTEAYAQRATVHYLRRHLDLSAADLRVVLAREPRHFTALTGLGVILQDIGRDKLALDAFRRALEIHPHLQAVPERIKLLEVKVEGREI